jgi:inosine/xanthosine triphosphatase
MIVVVGSNSPVKVEATRQAFSEYYADVIVESVNIRSGVNPFPWSDEEMLQGATNRVNGAQEAVPEADFYVGLEGGLQRLGDWMMVKQLAVVMRREEIGVGVSSGYDCPERLLSQLEPQMESGRRKIDAFFGEEEILSKQGAIGVLTQSKMSRTESSRDALICALTRFVSPEYYK